MSKGTEEISGKGHKSYWQAFNEGKFPGNPIIDIHAGAHWISYEVLEDGTIKSNYGFAPHEPESLIQDYKWRLCKKYNQTSSSPLKK